MTDETHTPWTIASAMTHILSVISSNDRRYIERFEASQKALELGMIVQTTATSAAFAAQKEAVSAAMAAAEQAVQKAEAASEKRFDSVNEFRATLSDQQRNLMPRAEVEVIIHSLSEKVTNLSDQVLALQSEKRGVEGGWGFAIGAIGLVLSVLSVASMVWGLWHK